MKHNVLKWRHYEDVKGISYLLAFFISLTACSCVGPGKSKVAAMRQTKVSGYSLASFNGNHANDPGYCTDKLNPSCFTWPSLWETLYSCKKPFERLQPVAPGATVNLCFDGRKKLLVSLSGSGGPVRQISLKAKEYKNNIAVKKRYFIIPLFLVYLRQERLVLLANNPDKSLNVGFSKITEFAILLGGADNYLYTLHFPRQAK